MLEECTQISPYAFLSSSVVAQVGIVSFGPSQCGGVGHIGGYTDVRAMRKWINGHVKEVNAKKKKLGWKDAEASDSPAASDKPFSRKLKAAAGDH